MFHKNEPRNVSGFIVIRMFKQNVKRLRNVTELFTDDTRLNTEDDIYVFHIFEFLSIQILFENYSAMGVGRVRVVSNIKS